MIELTPYSGAVDPAKFLAALKQLPLTAGDGAGGDYLDALLSATGDTPSEFWLATADGVAIGRIGAALSVADPARGYIGVFHVDLEHPAHAAGSQALIGAAAAWLRSRGARASFAPIDVNTWFRYRLSAPGSGGGPSFAWEPQSPPEYTALFAAAGYAPTATFHTTGFESADFAPALRLLAPHHARAVQAGFTFRPLATGPAVMDDLRIVHRLAQEGFKDSFLFEPIGARTFMALYGRMLGKVDYRPSHFIVSPAGEELGFMFAFVDQGYVVSKSVCVLPALLQTAKSRKWAASAALLYLALKLGEDGQLIGGVSALVKDDASSRLLERRQTWAKSWTHNYVLYSRDL